MDLKTISRLQTNSALLSRFKAAVQYVAVQILSNDAETPARKAWAVRANFVLGANRAQAYADSILQSAVIGDPKIAAAILQVPEDQWGDVGTDADIVGIVNTWVDRFAANDI